MTHATVNARGYAHIPLIGIPATATEYECDCCHDIFLIEELELNFDGTEFLCPKHRKKIQNPFPPSPP